MSDRTPGRYHIAVERAEQGRGRFRVAEEDLEDVWGTTYTSHPGSDDPVHAQDDETHLVPPVIDFAPHL